MASDLTKLVRAGVERATVAFTVHVNGLGFRRTRKMFWVRVHEHTADVLHLHRQGSSYGAPINASVGFRLHLAIRVLNDSFPGVALNGPNTDTAGREDRYHLRFNAESMDMFDRCVQDLGRFVRAIGEPWFLTFRPPDSLLDRGDSPLRDEDKARLRDALAGNHSAENLDLTRKELGLKLVSNRGDR
jgi:hypothetical protein